VLAAAVVALVLWVVLLVVVAVSTRPRVGEPGAPTSELPGPESPALVNLLTNGFEMTRAAVPATLLDLVARGFGSIQHIGPGQFVLRLSESSEPLTSYERQVWDHVSELAAGGEVPGAALTTGPPAKAEAWWRRFQRSVVAEARGKGLSRPRWTNGATTLLAALSLLPAFLVSRAATGSWDGDGVVLMLWLMPVLMLPLYALKRERDTALGRQAAGRWLAVREYLADDEAFCDQPPGGVAIWDRYLAYGAAMGVARGAVREMPMGSESATEAWSPYGGRWHVVQVAYPKWSPPGWGVRPSRAVATGLLALIPVAFILGVVLPLMSTIMSDVAGLLTGLVLAVFAIPFVTAAALGLRLAAMIVLGLLDVRAPTRTVSGMVVRMREVLIRRNKKTYSVQHYVAVDDGTGLHVDAWLVDNAKLAGIRPGVEVDVVVSPRLGWVERITPRSEGRG
jgi:Predicted membrane protein (DUF2207)